MRRARLFAVGVGAIAALIFGTSSAFAATGSIAAATTPVCSGGDVRFNFTITVSDAGTYTVSAPSFPTITVKLKKGENKNAVFYQSHFARKYTATLKSGTTALGSTDFTVTADQVKNCKAPAVGGSASALATTGRGPLNNPTGPIAGVGLLGLLSLAGVWKLRSRFLH
jgi:hypothetical protein